MTNEELKMLLSLLKENARGIKHTRIRNVKKEHFVWILDEEIKALEQTDKIEESNFSTEQYKADLQAAYDCGYAKALEQTRCIPKNATNGDMIISLYPNLKYYVKGDRMMTTIGVASSFDLEWWNAPYREEDAE